MSWVFVTAFLTVGLIVFHSSPPSFSSNLFLSHDYLPYNATPTQVHVSIAGPNRIRISWVTFDTPAPSVVEFGTRSTSYDKISVGNSNSYRIAFYKSGEIHNVVLENLNASSVYYYKCGGAGPEYILKTPPASGAQHQVTFAIAGDLGQTDESFLTLKNIQQLSYDIFLLPGDLSYADYYQPYWDSFGNMVEPLASSRPFMVTQGNHEVEHIPLILEPFKAYNARWKMPYEESGSDSNLYYSFEAGGAHVLMLGSYTDFGRDSAQYKWLQADLLRVNRSRTPWLIAVLHAPWYNSNHKHRGEGDAMMKTIESLLRKAKTDILFSGHVHAYERTSRVFNSSLDECGIVHVTVGVGGNREGLAQNFIDPAPNWSVYRDASYGYGILKVVNATHALWSWHRNQDAAAHVADEVWLESIAYKQVCSM